MSALLLTRVYLKISHLYKAIPAKQISEWWGVYSGQFIVLTNVPISIASSLAASSVPSLSTAYHAKDFDTVNRQISLATRFIMVIAIPSTNWHGNLGQTAQPAFIP